MASASNGYRPGTCEHWRAYHLAGSSTAAEDIAQEAFVRALRGLDRLRQLESAGGWLLAITRNEYLRWCRKWSAQPRLDEEPARPDNHVQELAQREWVESAVRQLPPEYRLVVLMFYFERKSYNEIAAELDIPLGTVMSRLNRGRDHLKRALVSLAEPTGAVTRSEPVGREVL